MPDLVEPANLVVTAVWDAPDVAPTEPTIGWVSDRGRRRLSTIVVAAGAVAGVVVAIVVRPAVGVMVLALALGVGAWLVLSGTSGFYELDQDDVPVTFLGRAGRDLSGRRRRRP